MIVIHERMTTLRTIESGGGDSDDNSTAPCSGVGRTYSDGDGGDGGDNDDDDTHAHQAEQWYS